MDLSLVIPLYNEEESLPELVEWIDRVMRENQYSYEILLVDDGSRDKSWEVITQLKPKYPAIRAFRFQHNYGKSAALHVGFKATKGDVVITLDADMQDSPDEIPELRRMIIEEGYDLVSGYKQKRYDPISKTLPTKLFNAVTRKVSGINNLHDFNCGLKAYRREVVHAVDLFGEMHRYIPVLAKWEGFDKIGEKVVQHRARKYGVTKFGLNRFVNGFLDLITITFITKYMKRPMHFFGFWGAICTFLGGGTLVYLAFIRLFLDIWISHRLPAMLFGMVLLLLGTMLFSTGLLGEYIGRNSPYKDQYKIREEV